MERICRCCGSHVNGIRCELCGMVYVAALDEHGQAEINRQTLSHQHSVLSRYFCKAIRTETLISTAATTLVSQMNVLPDVIQATINAVNTEHFPLAVSLLTTSIRTIVPCNIALQAFLLLNRANRTCAVHLLQGTAPAPAFVQELAAIAGSDGDFASQKDIQDYLTNTASAEQTWETQKNMTQRILSILSQIPNLSDPELRATMDLIQSVTYGDQALLSRPLPHGVYVCIEALKAIGLWGNNGHG